jgi:hypothetical protein
MGVDVALLVALLAATFGGLVFIWIGVLGLLGRLPPNRWAGIRTPGTFASPDAWRAGHRAGAARLVFGGVAILATGFALVPFTLAGKLDDVIVAAGTIGLLALHAATGLAAWVSVTRAARRV